MLFLVPLKGEFYIENIYLLNDDSKSLIIIRYDIKSDTWTEVAPLSTAREFAAAAVLSGAIYVMGGRDNENKLNSVECYIPNKNEWISIEPMNEIRSGAQAGVANGTLIVFGGRDERVSATIERYDPEENKWILVILVIFRTFL